MKKENARATCVSMIRTLIQKLYYRNLYFKGSIGKNVLLSRHGTVVNPKEVKIGDNVFISEYFHISAHKFTIGHDVIIGPRLTAICNNHLFDRIGQTAFEYASDKTYEPIVIESDVWLGANVILLPGVTVGQGCIVGAGSVVVKSLPPYTICVGVPCKPIRIRFLEEDLEKHLNALRWNEKTTENVVALWKQVELI